jgi:Transmembrane protein 43
MSEGDWSGGDGASWNDDAGSPGGDDYTETTSESWFSRIGKALIGIPIGLLLFVGSFVVLFWNEGRAVHTAQGLAEGKAVIVSVEPGRVDPANEGKFVHVGGEATTEETLDDPLFNLSAKAIRLRRVVQMYQWKESSETKTRKKLGGGEERITTYNYDRTWTDAPIDSSRFKKPDGHHNPSDWPFKTWTKQAQTVTLGAFKLPANLVDQIGGKEPLPVDQATLDALPEEARSKLKLDGGRFYRGDDPSSPEVGDMTVAFEQVKPQVVSLLAQQSGDSFGAYRTHSGTTIERLQAGTASAEAMIQQAEAENKFLTWVLRLVGFIVMGVGISMVLSLLTVLADVVPFIGNIVGFGTGFIAFGVAAVLSLVTIAIGWIAYRPIVGISILALAGLALFGFTKLARARRAGAKPRPLATT